MVEYHLAKVVVASSSLVICSIYTWEVQISVPPILYII